MRGQIVVIRENGPNVAKGCVDDDFSADASGVGGSSIDAYGDEFAFFAGGGCFRGGGRASEPPDGEGGGMFALGCVGTEEERGGCFGWRWGDEEGFDASEKEEQYCCVWY